MNLDDLDVILNGARVLDKVHKVLTRYVILPSPEATDATALWIAATQPTGMGARDPACHHGAREAVRQVPAPRHPRGHLSQAADHSQRQPRRAGALDRRERPADAAARRGRHGVRPEGRRQPRGPERHYQRGPSAQPSLYPVGCHRPAVRVLPHVQHGRAGGIGPLPDTIMDRAVIIRMRRRAPGENVEPYRTRRDRPPLDALRGRLASWGAKHRSALARLEPDLPVEDRAADNWEPLVAVADLAGGDWPSRARKAAVLLRAEDADADLEASLGLRLLADIRDVFAGLTVSFLSSADLTARLRQPARHHGRPSSCRCTSSRSC